jgi:DNA-binding response OmpR family regulator
VTKILIIEDDLSIAELERDYLEVEGFDCTIVRDGSDGLEAARSEQWDLIILDLMLPGIDGYSICRALRAETEIPILMVSSRTEDIDKIRGLGLGADDYVAKPFSPAELTARVKAHLARFERLKGVPQRRRAVSIGGLSIDLDTHTVSRGGRDINLTAKEFDLLYMLMSDPDRVFSREQIFDRVWGENYGDVSTVTVHVRKLREKIEENPSRPEYIETVWGIGYRFRA